MKQSAWIERNRKRELRILYRERRLEYEQSKRTPNRREIEEREARNNKEIIELLQEDHKKPKKLNKKPGLDTFLALYSYIPATPYDLRHTVLSSWKPHSFNERKQNLEFLKTFVYPYPLPETLLWVSHSPEYTLGKNGAKTKSSNYVFINLAKKWIGDITSGASFYKLNRQFFTKAETHYFLSSNVPYVDAGSVLTLYFYAKSRARSMNHRLSMMIADVFSNKFFNNYKNTLVEGFLDLLSRAPEYGYERNMLGDISDFVLSKMRENKKANGKQEAFSFSGRTITSVIKLTNEWHEEIRREAEAERIQREAQWRERNRLHGKEKSLDTSHWK